MTITSEQHLPLPANWQNTETYRWMGSLPRTAWAWELMRRNPDYRALFSRLGPASAGEDGELWPLMRLEDPELDARSAAVFWRCDVCPEVLPVAASIEFRNPEVRRLSLRDVHCRVFTLPGGGDHCHVLFAQQGRFFQLSVCGASHLDDGLLLTPVLSDPALYAARQLAIRRLGDLVSSGCLRLSFYPQVARSDRMTRVVQALDGEMAGVPHRDIGIALFGRDRVEREWHHPHNYLRDHVRRAIAHGRELMLGGFRRLLQ
ncbi:MAG: DUF2285 domain-containing protein [Rhizomicrobium sp.]